MKNIFISLIILISTFSITFAEEVLQSNDDNGITQIDEIINIEIEKKINNLKNDFKHQVERKIPKNIYLESSFNINIEEQINIIKNNIQDIEINTYWNIDGEIIESDNIQKEFDSKGVKNIQLELTYKENDNEVLFLEMEQDILIFEKTIPLIYSENIDQLELNRYIDDAKREGILIYEIGPINYNDIEISNFVTNLNNFINIIGEKYDYSIIWGSRDFIFNILGKINREFTINPELQLKDYSFIALSSYNMKILESYIQNFLANKSWLKTILISNENTKHLIFAQNTINGLKSSLEENQYDYIDINLEGSEISEFLFISKFINNLTNIGYSTNGIYLLILIPFILTLISFSKHFIGISPIGIVIPTFLTILFFKLGLLLTLGLLGVFLLINLGVSYLTNRYNLLYAPKISFFITINIIIFIYIINLLFTFNIIPLDLNDIIYFVIFIIITERFINIIASKDLSEYKEPFINTIVISIVAFIILGFNFIKIILLAYPEIIIALIPINFLIGRFTGLRVTEYFRFKEVIKNIEE